MTYKSKFDDNGFIIKKFKDKTIVRDIKKIIKAHFNKPITSYCKMSIEKFHNEALKCQKKINKLGLQKKFHESEKNIINQIVGKNDSPLYESIIFLRAVRPSAKVSFAEGVTMHRETFYSDHSFVKHSVNIWFPIANVGKNSSIKYIPKSHKIADEKIKRRRVPLKNHPIKKFSPGHKLGFFYAPKKIVSGVNLEKEKKMLIPVNSYALFSAMLVHGNGQNYTNDIRFAIGFGLVPKKMLKKNKVVDKRRFGNGKQKLMLDYSKAA
jgi:ectoine hydroxylase-related dioxygenase (phytanoyl-CoA dioxygenase family)